MSTTALLIFIATYTGIALGRIPGLTLDRTGIALFGAIAMVVTGVMTSGEALASIHAPTLLLLYALMIVSAQLRLGGFYTRVALAITAGADRPHRFLFALMLVSAALSAVLANDVVCLAFTPVLCYALPRARLNPVPFLIALAISSNIGSATTLIGNPQNMLIGQMGQLDFGHYLAWAIVPSTLALLLAYGLIVQLTRRSWPLAPSIVTTDTTGAWPAFNRWQSIKGGTLTLVLIALFFTPIPAELSALGVAAILLCSRRMHTREMLGLVDWNLITLFCGLFIVIHGIEVSGYATRAMEALSAAGWDLHNPYRLAGITLLLSNAISNVPAVMLLSQFVDPADPHSGYVLALSSTLAGNLITLGSIANLIVIVQAKAFGITIRFSDHARIGIPVTVVSFLITLLWIAL